MWVFKRLFDRKYGVKTYPRSDRKYMYLILYKSLSKNIETLMPEIAQTPKTVLLEMLPAEEPSDYGKTILKITKCSAV